MSSLLQSPFVLVGGAFFVGVVVMLVIGRLFSSAPEGDDKTSREHRVRALEADQRVSQKRIGELEEDLESTKKNLENVSQESEALRETLKTRESELADARKTVATECQKTAKLRKELTGRAEETIRAHAQIKDIETELDIVQAGSDVVAEQFERLAKENDDPTGQHAKPKIEDADDKEDKKSSKLESAGFILDS
jgi:chromosome segregation ATPase